MQSVVKFGFCHQKTSKLKEIYSYLIRPTMGKFTVLVFATHSAATGGAIVTRMWFLWGFIQRPTVGKAHV